MSFCVRVHVFVSVHKILLNLKEELDCPSQIAAIPLGEVGVWYMALFVC